MSDGEHSDVRRWLADDPFVLNAVFLVAASSLAIALTSYLWHHFYSLSPPAFPFSDSRPLPALSQQQSLSSEEQKDRKSTRSKERRRRGKDPFRELLKGGKKSKALLKAIKVTDLNQPPHFPDDTLSNTCMPGDDSMSSSRSPSPEPTGSPLDLDRLTPHPSTDSSDSGSVRANDDASSSNSPVPTSVDAFGHSVSDVSCSADARPSGSMATADAEVNIDSAQVLEAASSSPPVSVPCAGVRTPQPRDSQAASMSESCVKLVRARTRIRATKIDQSARYAADGVALVPCPPLSRAASTRSADGAGPSTPTNTRSTPSRSLSPPEELRYPESNIIPNLGQASEAQLASMREALEAAQFREEQLRVEAEQASKERDELCWRWNEDAGVWRRREAELQAQIHHLMQQLQAYAAVASFQAQQASSLPSSGFSSPTSPHIHLSSPRLQHHAPLGSFPLPPGIQTQNSASAPAHVQALLASAPMLTPHPPGFTAPVVSGALYPGTGLSLSPLLWSGMGLCVPNRDPRYGGRRTPDSSASGSSPRGRRRRRAENVRSASDESSLGDWDGSEDDGLWEEEKEEDDIFRNNALADAILKRPESLRGLSASVRKRSGVGPERIQEMGATKDPDPASEKQGIEPPLSIDTLAVTP